MRRTSAVVCAALLSSTMALPALAAWDRVGSVRFSDRNSYDTMDYVNARSDALLLTARNSDVMCRSVTATFGNGRTREIFRGELRRGQAITVDLPGRERNIDRVEFNCRPLDRPFARVDVAANTDVRDSIPRQLENTFRDVFR